MRGRSGVYPSPNTADANKTRVGDLHQPLGPVGNRLTSPRFGVLPADAVLQDTV
jgi:hypothetical protein